MSDSKPEESIMKSFLNGVATVLLFFAFLFICACFGSCRTCKHLSTTTQTHEMDSVRIEVKKEVVYVPDTVYVEIPPQKAERTTADSTSHLENDYAVSDAAIKPDGSLFHSLETKPQQKPVEYQKPIERKDSIVYRTKEVPVPYPVTEYVNRDYTWWDKTRFYAAYAFIVLLIVMLRKPIWKVLQTIFPLLKAL